MAATIFVTIVIVTAFTLYFLPALIAFHRDHQNKSAIGILNMFAGWTLLGWIAALVWAFTSKPEPQVVYVQQVPSPPPQQLMPR